MNTILTPGAFQFVRCLSQEFETRRKDLLQLRKNRRGPLRLFPETESIRKDLSWKVVQPPMDLKDRRVEITGPAEPKMIINALNSSAQVFMADFEDALSPTWSNLMLGQAALKEANKGTLALNVEGKTYQLNDRTATLVVRPRGLHMIETHMKLDGEPVSASLFDFGVYLFHNLKELLEKGSGPYFYLPKLESHLEARWWNDVFIFSQRYFGVPRSTIRATVLIETIPAAFEMEEILFELRDHSSGLNAGRWDYLFSLIKKHSDDPGMVLPDRDQLTMATDFMSAYAERLAQTCLRRGAQAIGGMSAFIPNKNEPEVTEQAFLKVAADKEREARLGFHGTWVAHPALIEVARKAMNQRAEPATTYPRLEASSLLNTKIPQAKVTETGVRKNIRVTLAYLCHWLDGRGAVGIENLMEDMATAEISRSQLWQWLKYQTPWDDGQTLTPAVLQKLIQEESQKLKLPHLNLAQSILQEICLAPQMPEFITTLAYNQLNEINPIHTKESHAHHP